MLTIEFSEQDQVRQKGLHASTFVAQPFWQEIQIALHDMVQERLNAMEQAKDASDLIKARLLDRWTWTKEIAARIERIPQAAIEAARELGEEE